MRHNAFCFALLLPVLAAPVALGAENYGARAEAKASNGKRVAAPVTISIDRLLTDDEKTALTAAFKSGDPEVLKKALASQPSLGYVDRGRVKISIKFVSSRPYGKGKTMTLACDEQMTYVGGDIPDVEKRPGFDLTYILLTVDAEGKGTGEIVPAAKVRLRDDGSLVVTEYGAEVIDLEDVAREK
jgi:hypothetical protein